MWTQRETQNGSLKRAENHHSRYFKMLCPVEEPTKSMLANALATFVIEKAQGHSNKPAIEEHF